MQIAGFLTGTRVLDLTAYLSGPFCTQLLAALGAEVIKIERPDGGEGARKAPPYVGRQGSSPLRRDETDIALSVLKRNRHKKSVTINLATDAGRAIFLKLTESADVVVENFTPGTMEKLGLAYECLRAVRPDLIMCSISGFGQTGPLRSAPAFDAIIQARAGMGYVNGFADQPPLKSGLLVGDQLGALYGALAIVAALRRRDRTGEGEYIDISLLDAVLATLWDEPYDYYLEQGRPTRAGSRMHRYTPGNFFPAADGYVAIVVGNDRQWEQLLAVMGKEPQPEFATTDQRVAAVERVEAFVAEWTETQPVAVIVERLSAAQVPCAPVLDLLAAVEQEHMQARGLFVPLEHPFGVDVPYVATQFPARFHNVATTQASPAPTCGQHTAAVLVEAGFSETQIEAWRREGVV